MEKKITWVENKIPKEQSRYQSVMSFEEISKVRDFHRSFPQYGMTPLVRLSRLAEYLGVQDVFVKDESYRFDLNSFKVLGGSYAMAKYIAGQVGRDVSEMSYDVLISDELKQEFGSATFFLATDGNHGKGVAWSASKLRQKAVVYMPKGTTQNRLERIRAEGATVTIEDKNYDECVRMAAAAAEQTKNGVLVQDTAWDGYEDIPTWIMQGYGTLALEADEQMKEYGCSSPTHVFVQAGVGAFAGAVQGYFADRYPEAPPTVIVVEPDVAACHYESAAAGDGKIRIIDGDMQSIMAGLACGEPGSISWDILKNNSKIFTSCPDWVTVRGMRMLAAPIKGDRQVVSGESGAVTAGLLASIMKEPEYEDLRNAAGLNADSRVLLVSTEGDTDPDRYKDIVWNASKNESFI